LLGFATCIRPSTKTRIKKQKDTTPKPLISNLHTETWPAK
jgi:hypothetical protein